VLLYPQGDTAMDLDDALDMDVDAMPAEVAAALSTRATKGLEGPGPADAAAFESRADPAAASLVWRPRPDGTIDLPPAGAVMDDADDPGEDDVNMLQVRGATGVCLQPCTRSMQVMP